MVIRSSQDAQETWRLVKQFAPSPVRSLHALAGQYLPGSLCTDDQYAAHAVGRGVIVNRVITVSPVNLLQATVPGNGHPMIHIPRRALARHHLLDLRSNDRPDLAPHFFGRPPQ